MVRAPPLAPGVGECWHALLLHLDQIHQVKLISLHAGYDGLAPLVYGPEALYIESPRPG